jgi:hypothetical protein
MSGAASRDDAALEIGSLDEPFRHGDYPGTHLLYSLNLLTGPRSAGSRNTDAAFRLGSMPR